LRLAKPSISKNKGQPITIITLMGVSGCGKTSVGNALAKVLGWEFIEGDAYHPKENIEKMASGLPLTDADRLPWLQSLHNLLMKKQTDKIPVVLACSALKAIYRKVLFGGLTDCEFVYLKGEYALILEKMHQRDHFMKPSLLQSQFEALQEPEHALIVPINIPVEQIVEYIFINFNVQVLN
jgi:gluconokinase